MAFRGAERGNRSLTERSKVDFMSISHLDEPTQFTSLQDNRHPSLADDQHEKLRSSKWYSLFNNLDDPGARTADSKTFVPLTVLRGYSWRARMRASFMLKIAAFEFFLIDCSEVMSDDSRIYQRLEEHLMLTNGTTRISSQAAR